MATSVNPNVDQDYATNEDAVVERAARWLDKDPYPKIPRALLTAEHIKAYVKATGMIYPFHEGGLKSASYEMALRGEVIWWDEDKVKQRIEVKGNKPAFVELAPNSITFVQVEPTFRLPRYMAIRFNLRIALVHRGLLLGTGPLVDPGFAGRLLIPLHNLTATICRIDLRKALIWVEFTKTTYGIAPGDHQRKDHLFPDDGKNLTPDEYLYKASLGEPILSSIPQATKDAKERAVAAETDAKKSASALDKIRNIGIIVVITVVAGIAAIVYNSLNLSATLTGQMNNLNQNMMIMQKDLTASSKDLAALTKRVSDIEGRSSIDPVKAEADRTGLAKSIADVSARVDELSRREALPDPQAVPLTPPANPAARRHSRSTALRRR